MAERLEIIISAKDQASAAIKGVTGSLTDLGKLTAKGLAVGLGAAAAGMAMVGGAAVKLAMDAAPLQGVQMAFEGLAESAGKGADEMLAALQKGSAGMVTNRDLMMSFNKAAQLVGKDFATQLPDAMQYLGKVAMATGQDMNYMLDSLVVGVGRMSPMILDNLGIQVKLSDATERAAEMFGVEASELTKAQQQAGMMNVVLEKLQENTAAMPDVTETAQQKFAAFRTTLQNAKDEIGLALLPAITPLIGKLAELASKILPKVIAAITPFINKIANLITVLFDAGAQSLEFKEALGAIVGVGAAEFIIKIIDFISQLAKTISDFVTGTLVPFIQQHWEAFKTALMIVGGILAAGAIAAGIIAIVGAISSLINPITLIIGLIGLLAAAWANNWGGIRDKVMAVVEFLRPYIQAFIGAIQQFWADHGEQIIAAVQAAWSTIQSIISAVVEAISGIVNGALSAIQGFWQKHGSTIQTIASSAWKFIQALISTVLSIIKSIFNAFKSAFEGDWKGFGENLRAAWDTAWQFIVNILKTAGQLIITAIQTLIRNIIDKFKSTNWAQVGKNIVQGIAKGITAGAQWVINAVKKIAAAALAAIKGFFGIGSPSKLMADIGQDLMKGLAIGIKGGVDIPVKATIGAAQDVASATSQSLTNNYWNLTINEAGARGNVVSDFMLLKALSGV